MHAQQGHGSDLAPPGVLLQGKLAGNSLSALLQSATGTTGGMGGRLLHAYRGAYVATIVLAVLLAALVIAAYLLRTYQRLKQDGRLGTGARTAAPPSPPLLTASSAF